MVDFPSVEDAVAVGVLLFFKVGVAVVVVVDGGPESGAGFGVKAGF